MPIVLYYALQKTVKQVVRSGPAFCSCSQQDRNVEQHMFNLSLALATGSAEFAVSNIAPTISAIIFARILQINELVSSERTIVQNGGIAEDRVNAGDSIH